MVKMYWAAIRGRSIYSTLLPCRGWRDAKGGSMRTRRAHAGSHDHHSQQRLHPDRGGIPDSGSGREAIRSGGPHDGLALPLRTILEQALLRRDPLEVRLRVARRGARSSASRAQAGMTRAGGTSVRIESFRVEALKSLLADGQGPHLSIYLPTQRRHPDRKQVSARLHSLLHRAKELLESRNAVRDVEAFLEPLRQLDAESLAEHALDGLALFRSEASVAAYRLPMPVPEIVVAADTYHTKPLLRFLRSNGRYLVLCVSQNEVALHEGGPYGAGPVDLHGVPKSFRDAIGVPDFDRSLESSYLRGAVFHGQGPGKELKKEELLRFFNAV